MHLISGESVTVSEFVKVPKLRGGAAASGGGARRAVCKHPAQFTLFPWRDSKQLVFITQSEFYYAHTIYLVCRKAVIGRECRPQFTLRHSCSSVGRHVLCPAQVARRAAPGAAFASLFQAA